MFWLILYVSVSSLLAVNQLKHASIFKGIFLLLVIVICCWFVKFSSSLWLYPDSSSLSQSVYMYFSFLIPCAAGLIQYPYEVCIQCRIRRVHRLYPNRFLSVFWGFPGFNGTVMIMALAWELFQRGISAHTKVSDCHKLPARVLQFSNQFFQCAIIKILLGPILINF